MATIYYVHLRIFWFVTVLYSLRALGQQQHSTQILKREKGNRVDKRDDDPEYYYQTHYENKDKCVDLFTFWASESDAEQFATDWCACAAKSSACVTERYPDDKALALECWRAVEGHMFRADTHIEVGGHVYANYTVFSAHFAGMLSNVALREISCGLTYFDPTERVIEVTAHKAVSIDLRNVPIIGTLFYGSKNTNDVESESDADAMLVLPAFSFTNIHFHEDGTYDKRITDIKFEDGHSDSDSEGGGERRGIGTAAIIASIGALYNVFQLLNGVEMRLVDQYLDGDHETAKIAMLGIAISFVLAIVYFLVKIACFCCDQCICASKKDQK